MNTQSNKSPENRLIKNFKYVLLATSISMFFVILLGSVTRVTNAGLSCPDWPTCFGELVPPSGDAALINYLHRVITAAATGLLIVSLWIANKQYSTQKLIMRPLIYAAFLVAVEIFGGAAVVFFSIPPMMVAVHLGIGLLILGFIIIPTVILFVSEYDGTKIERLKFPSYFSRFVVWVTASIFMVFITGTGVAAIDTGDACLKWPLCEGGIIPTNLTDWIHVTHRLVVILLGVSIVVLLGKAWKSQRTQRAILSAMTLTASLYIAQTLVGAFFAIEGYSATLLGLHSITVAALWSSTVILLTFTGIAARTDSDEAAESPVAFDSKKRIKDLITLTKPIIVALLLVTTYTGMVLGAEKIPGLGVTFWTLLAGLFAAGGSGAINQYIDRELDQKMTRTATRPIASGRMTPAEGLAFGLGLLVAAFYLMALFVNLLAALLSLAGMIYYIILYSMFLKHTTDQNIVIGGGAGAIPPLVGWAAVTGTLDISALFLFAIIFLWTPPHFWALALVRKKDYEGAGIPMLPVSRGRKVTQWQILLYTLALAALTILMPLLNLAGSFFLVSAIALGSGLIFVAWKVWTDGGNKIAWKMYRYSSMYLAFLFAALIIDTLL